MKRVSALVVLAVMFATADGSADDLARARAYDQDGVRLYREGKYREALAAFRGAREAGGPSLELWNIARCHQKLGENREEAQAIEKYLSEGGLTKEDRNEASNELHRLTHLPSPLVVTSEPSGARVKVDGSFVGETPLTTNIAPGTHQLTAEHPRWTEPSRLDVDAAYGGPLQWDARGHLREGRDAREAHDARGARDPARANEPKNQAQDGHEYTFEDSPSIGLVPSFGFGVFLPQYGGVGGSAHVQANLRVLYTVWRMGPMRVLVGARGMFTTDSWSNNVSAPTQIPGCSVLYDNQDASSFFLMASGMFERALGAGFRVAGEVGIGATWFSASQVGGDLFFPSCTPGTKAEPTFLFGAIASYDVTKRLRVQASPLVLDFTPALVGTRDQPKDATGVWTRIGADFGLAFEF